MISSMPSAVKIGMPTERRVQAESAVRMATMMSGCGAWST